DRRWETSDGAGGSSWPYRALERPILNPNEVRVLGRHHTQLGDDPIRALYGVAGEAIKYVKLTTNGDSQRNRVDSKIGAWVVAYVPTTSGSIELVNAGDSRIVSIDLPDSDAE